jgi:hypothetical protein
MIRVYDKKTKKLIAEYNEADVNVTVSQDLYYTIPPGVYISHTPSELQVVGDGIIKPDPTAPAIAVEGDGELIVGERENPTFKIEGSYEQSEGSSDT